VAGDAALDLLDGVTELLVAKGRTKIVRVDLAGSRPDDDTLLGLLLGRSGKLRAPALRRGSRFFVGYNREMMPELLAPPPGMDP
jgi:hypothetical protein